MKNGIRNIQVEGYNGARTVILANDGLCGTPPRSLSYVDPELFNSEKEHNGSYLDHSTLTNGLLYHFPEFVCHMNNDDLVMVKEISLKKYTIKFNKPFSKSYRLCRLGYVS